MHPKIKELKLRATPVTTSSMKVDGKGELVDENVIKGYAIVWGEVDDYGTKFIKGCCAKSLQERGPASSSKYKITALWQHDQKDPIGQFRVLTEDDYGLYFEMVIDNIAEVPNGIRAIKQVRSGTINQFSFGFDYIWDKIEYDATDDSLVCKEIELYEISPVTRGACTETHAIRSTEDFENVKLQLQDETEDFIRSIPRKQQLELRQIITRHISLAGIKPLELRQPPALEPIEPIEAEPVGLDYEFLTKNLKLF